MFTPSYIPWSASMCSVSVERIKNIIHLYMYPIFRFMLCELSRVGLVTRFRGVTVSTVVYFYSYL